METIITITSREHWPKDYRPIKSRASQMARSISALFDVDESDTVIVSNDHATITFDLPEHHADHLRQYLYLGLVNDPFIITHHVACQGG